METAIVEKRKYKEVKARLFADCVRPLLHEGGGIPSKQTLARRYGVNVGTLDKALQELVVEGFVEKRRGSGTYVLPQKGADNGVVGLYFCLERFGDPKVSKFSHLLYELLLDRLPVAGYGCRHYVDVRPERMLGEPLPQLLEDIADRKISSLILVRSDWHYDSWLNSLNIPVIATSRDFGWGTIATDPRKDGSKAADLLIERGCKKVELLSVLDKEWELTPDTLAVMRPLRAGMTNALLAEGLPAPDVWLTPEVYPESIRNLHYSFDDVLRGYELCKVLFQIAHPDGIVVYTDVMAIGAARALKEIGLTVGKDVQAVILGSDELTFPGLENFIRLDVSISAIADHMITLTRSAMEHEPPKTYYLSRHQHKGSDHA